MWARRYRGIVVSDEEEMQIARLKYVLAAGSRELLVDRVDDWPGVHSARALIDGERFGPRVRMVYDSRQAMTQEPP